MSATRDYPLTDAKIVGDTLHVDLWYPRTPGALQSVTLGLMDVRAADDIRISYDFDRDGWKVEQSSRFSWRGDDPACDPDWQEVAFIQAWGRKESPEAEEQRLCAPVAKGTEERPAPHPVRPHTPGTPIAPRDPIEEACDAVERQAEVPRG